MSAPARCFGFPHEGACDQPAGHPREDGLPASTIFCAACDRSRVQYIGAKIDALVRDFCERENKP